MTFVQAIDVSNYTGPFTEQGLAFIRDNVHTVIIGLQNATIARQQQAQLKASCPNAERMYYVDIPGRDLTIPEAGAMVWVDIEVGCFVWAQDVRNEVARITARGLVPGIYGNKVSITPVMGTSTELSYLPLWWANYVDAPADFLGFRPFLGWTECAMWQYSSDGVAGINCDINLLEISEEDPMAGIARRSDDGHFIEFMDPNGFVVMRYGSTDGQHGSRISRPWGDPNNGGYWQWLRTAKTSNHTYWSKIEGD